MRSRTLSRMGVSVGQPPGRTCGEAASLALTAH
jgi:hypothetical protein